jgi:glyoxylase-like metal-dependent hydrolase (beta-lactamase superfamily II)
MPLMASNRRQFLLSSAGVLAAGALGRRSVARAWQRQQPPPATFTPIRRNVGQFVARGGTVGYLINADGIVVVDSQYPDSAARLLEGLNERSGGRAVDVLLNTHHHFDHTEGNIVFKGVAKHVVAHARAAEHMRQPPGRQAQPGEKLFPDTTFADTWRADVGDERIRATHYGRAHTSGDAVITFERANVAHLGDLGFNRRQPVIDRPAGAFIGHWATVLDRAVADHDGDTIFIFGHTGSGVSVTGPASDVTRFAAYLRALLEFTGGQIKAGRSAAEITAIRDPLKGFEDFGALTATVLGNAHGELTEGTGTRQDPPVLSIA